MLLLISDVAVAGMRSYVYIMDASYTDRLLSAIEHRQHRCHMNMEQHADVTSAFHCYQTQQVQNKASRGTTASSTCTDAEQHGDLSCFPVSREGADDAQVAVQIARAPRSALLHECLCRPPWLSF